MARAAGAVPGTVAGPVLWLDGAHGAAEHMARDAALLEAVASGAWPGPVFRLYRFAPPAITLGRAQSPERELDLAALERAGIGWAVRPTGGGAIWHEQAWTLALAGRLGPGGWAGTPRGAVERTGGLLAAALRSLGVPAETSSDAGARATGGPPAPCFSATGRHEVVARGRKLAGIAQRVSRRAFLQQVNVLLGDAHLSLARWLRAAAPDRAALADAWARHSVGAAEWLGAEPPLARFAEALLGALGPAAGAIHVHRGAEPPAPLAPAEAPRRSA